jgi:hypothetical protein
MQFSFDIASAGSQEKVDPAAPGVSPLTEVSFAPLVLGVLQQMLENQRQAFQEMTGLLRDHLNHARAVQQEQLARWKSMLHRWEQDFPELPENARKVYPAMEKSYIDMLNQLATDLADRGDDAFDNEFALQEFLDRNAMKIGQFSHLLSILGPISEVGNQIASQKEQL